MSHFCQFLVGDSFRRNEARRLPLSQGDRPGFVEQQHIHIETREEIGCDGAITALGIPGASGVAPADVYGARDTGDAAEDRAVQLGIELQIGDSATSQAPGAPRAQFNLKAILQQMVQLGYATEKEVNASYAKFWKNYNYRQADTYVAQNSVTSKAPYFTDYVRNLLQTKYLLGTADIYHDGTNFRLMELNLGSPVGGQDNAMLNEVLLEHPAVAESAAVGRPDPERGEVIVSFVVLRDGFTPGPALARAIQDLVRDRLVEDPPVAELEHVVLQCLQLDTELIGRVGDSDLAEIRQARLRTHRREFRTPNRDLVVALRVGIGEGLSLRGGTSKNCSIQADLSRSSRVASLTAQNAAR